MKKKKSEQSEKNAYERLLKTQSDRIDELRKQNADLEQTLLAYRLREKEIADTLAFAKQKGEEYLSIIRMKYALECDRIDRFREKLDKYRSREELLKGYDDSFRELKAWQNDLEKALTDESGAELHVYREERERLGDDPQLRYGEIVQKEKTDLLTADRITEEELKELLEQL